MAMKYPSNPKRHLKTPNIVKLVRLAHTVSTLLPCAKAAAGERNVIAITDTLKVAVLIAFFILFFNLKFNLFYGFGQHECQSACGKQYGRTDNGPQKNFLGFFYFLFTPLRRHEKKS